jgi:hypothetical protein
MVHTVPGITQTINDRREGLGKCRIVPPVTALDLAARAPHSGDVVIDRVHPVEGLEQRLECPDSITVRLRFLEARTRIRETTRQMTPSNPLTIELDHSRMLRLERDAEA